MNKNFFKLKILILFFFLIFPGLVSASLEKKIIVLPFKIESQEKLEFLAKGIVHMLETRLKIPGQSFAVSPGKEELKNLKADYILEGTIFFFGDSVSTEAKLINADSGKEELVFTQVGNNKGDVLKHIDLFAERIRTEVFNLRPANVFRGESENGYQQRSADIRKPVIWKSMFFDAKIKSIAVSDIDNDSKNETIILSNNSIQVFRRTDNSFKKLSEIRIAGKNKRHLFVDVIDLDNDGTKEIFITSINEKTLSPASSLYKWSTSGLIKTADNIKWLLRAVEKKNNGRILLGQKTKVNSSNKFATGIFELKMDKTGGLSPSNLSFPFADNIFGLAFGDFMNNGEETIALLDLKGNLSIYSSEGNQLFTSPEKYGGSESYIEYKGMRYTKDDGYQMDRIYLQQRIFAADLYQDGKTSLITIKNNDASKGLFSKLRTYDKGRIESLLWNELGMDTQGSTQKIVGYISDFTIADMDTNGKKEIIFTIVSSKGSFGTKTSRIISQSFIAKDNQSSF